MANFDDAYNLVNGFHNLVSENRRKAMDRLKKTAKKERFCLEHLKELKEHNVPQEKVYKAEEEYFEAKLNYRDAYQRYRILSEERLLLGVLLNRLIDLEEGIEEEE